MNLLELKKGQMWWCQDAHYNDWLFTIGNVQKRTRHILNQKYPFVEYESAAIGIERKMNLLVVGDARQVAILSLYDEFGYAKEFEEVVRDNTGIFRIEDNGEAVEFHSTLTPHESHEAHNDPENEEILPSLEVWFYGRDPEMLIVEMNKNTGWFEIWRGREVDASLVDVL